MSPARVLVTGGATGIGAGIAAHLVGLGYCVVITGRRADVLSATAAAIGATAVPGDVTSDPSSLLDRVGPLQHLVNNAGSYTHAPVGSWNAVELRQQLEIHGVAPALLAQEFASRPGTGDRSVVTISSTLATRGAPGAGLYAAGKAAGLALTRALAQELAPRGVRANALLPGVVPTAMTAAPRTGVSTEEQLAGLRALHPLGRLGTPDDIAQAVAWLLSATWVTGAEIPIDGGLLVG